MICVNPDEALRQAKRQRIEKARMRLENAALTIGDMFAAEVDPGWDECQELEAAAMAYRNAVRGERGGL